ncbi:MAG: glutamate--tRNA ligase [candidate division WOR-3 bacterium]|nr:MAG: glutamate--tRNA ligase [candidate division WOR-3 bacterium]
MLNPAVSSSASRPVRVRVAPSPTGAMHLGLARTALYNWLFARHHQGTFVLRIDDTDVERNLDEALAPILRGFCWLGIDWDEGPQTDGPHAPYYQSRRTARYREVVGQLLESGAAYLDYATAAETSAEREAAIAMKRSTRYSRRWMADTPEKRARFEAEGRQAVVRLKMPSQASLAVDDLVRGKVEFDWALEQDHVIQRADGSCLYHLASAVDDHDFEISHVIRAEEHLSNTARQVFIFQAMRWEVPQFAHLPLVAEPGSKNKLSKRKLAQYLRNKDFADLVARGRKLAESSGPEIGPDALNPVSVEFYERVGFLPDAVVNYLALLGWALDDRTEEFTREQLIEAFSLDKVNKSPSSYDPAKLMAFQTRQMLALPVERRAELAMPFLVRAGVVAEPESPEARGRVERIVGAAGDRIKVAADILDYTDFFTEDEGLAYDEKAFRKRVCKPGAVGLLRRLREEFAGVREFEPGLLEQAVRAFVDREGVRIGDIIHALRVAVTGKAVGFGMYDTLAILGRESTVNRIDRAVARAEQTKD